MEEETDDRFAMRMAEDIAFHLCGMGCERKDIEEAAEILLLAIVERYRQ